MAFNPHPVFARLRSLASSGTVIVAHRGNSSAFPENTLAAFDSARELGVAMQEFDIRTTRDGELVCIHDETLDRTTDSGHRLGPGALVAQLDLREIEAVDAGSWFAPQTKVQRVPRLDQVLAAVQPAIAMIEHKAGEPAAYVEALRRLGVTQDVLVQSFDWDFVRAVRELAPEIATGALGPRTADEHTSASVVAQVLSIGAGLLHWHAPELTADETELARSRGLLVCTYTTDDGAQAVGLAAQGVDAMCTNRPAAMLALQRRGALSRRG